MAAGLGFKDFTTGEVLTAADVDGYLMQGVWVFASAAARDAAVTSPQEGNFAYLKDTNVTTYYTGSAWANLDTTGMTNPMTTTGDVIYSSSGSTPARLGIGSTGDVLTVAGGVPSWAAPAGGLTYSTWTPTYTNMSIGNGTVTAEYAQSGNFVHAYFKFILGSTSSISTDASLTLPVNLASSRTTAAICAFRQSGIANYLGMVSARFGSSVTELVFNRINTTGQGQISVLSSSAPFSWTTSDEIWFSIVYKGV